MGAGKDGKGNDGQRECECKLDAQHIDQLKLIRDHILSTPHYLLATDPVLRPALIQDMELLGVPENFSGARTRIYYDDINLNGFRNDVEIRIEPKRKEAGEDNVFKQMVKIGGNRATDRDGTFDRREYPVKLPSPVPDLSLVKNGGRRKLQDVFGVDDLANVKLLPMIMLVSQRWKIEYHPEGDTATRIEYAHDVGRGETFTGFRWDFFQAELEIKAGNAAILPREKRRLLDSFNFLSTGTRSKPSPGFEELTRVLVQPETRKAAAKDLKPGFFQILKL
jgi:hypothetical protein